MPARDLRIAPPGRFYDVAAADLPGAPGSLIRSLELRAPAGTRAWAVIYRSTGQDGSSVPVSGLVLAPEAPLAPDQAAGRQVIAWAHGTTGIADACAPSRAGVSGVGFPPILELVRQGFVITATDYEGLGAPGLHPYLVGSSEGRSILDSIRAARALPEAGGGNRAAIVGISQGGHAAIWAAELVDAYAAELDVVGAVAASPPMDLRAVQRAVLGGADAGAVAWLESLMVAAAWRSVYAAPLDGLLTGQAMRIVRELEDTCPSSIDPPTHSPFRVDPGSVPEWQALLEANSPGHRASRPPMLVLAATEDTLVPASTIPNGIDRLCGAGSNVTLRWIDGPHAATLATPAAATLAFSWTMDRLRGAPAVNGCD
jgi:Secretory lipase